MDINNLIKYMVAILFSFGIAVLLMTMIPFDANGDEMRDMIEDNLRDEIDDDDDDDDDDDGDRFCHRISAKIESFFVSEGCESPTGTCTEGEITQGGFLNGSTNFTNFGLGFAAGMVDVEPLTTLSYSGLLVVETKHGTLVLDDVGILDSALGVFTEIDRVVEGTGRFEGTTGILFISGDATETGFKGEIKGKICFSD